MLLIPATRLPSRSEQNFRLAQYKETAWDGVFQTVIRAIYNGKKPDGHVTLAHLDNSYLALRGDLSICLQGRDSIGKSLVFIRPPATITMNHQAIHIDIETFSLADSLYQLVSQLDLIDFFCETVASRSWSSTSDPDVSAALTANEYVNDLVKK